MINYTKYIFLIFLVALVGCPSQNQVLLTIDGDRYTIAHFKLYAQFSPTEDSLQRMEKIDDFVNHMLVVKEARERGYEDDPVVTDAFETHRKKLLSQGYYEEKVIKKIKISESEVRKVYNQIIDQYHLAQIVVSEESLAYYIGEELKKGVSFDSLLKFSLDTLTENGDIGSFSVLSLPPEVLEPVKNTKVGGNTGVIKFGNYFYILKVIEHKKADTPQYADVKDNIRDNLMREKAIEEGDKFVQDLLDKAKIEYNQEGLDVLLKPDSLLTEVDLNTWVVKKYDTAYVYVKTIRDAVLYQYRRSMIDPKQLINRELIPDLMYDEALKIRLQNQSEMKRQLQHALDLLVYQKLNSDEVLEKAIVDSLEVVKFYKEHWAGYQDKKFSEVYTTLKVQLRDEKINSLRTILFTELRKKYNPQLDERVLAKLLKEES